MSRPPIPAPQNFFAGADAPAKLSPHATAPHLEMPGNFDENAPISPLSIAASPTPSPVSSIHSIHSIHSEPPATKSVTETLDAEPDAEAAAGPFVYRSPSLHSRENYTEPEVLVAGRWYKRKELLLYIAIALLVVLIIIGIAVAGVIANSAKQASRAAAAAASARADVPVMIRITCPWGDVPDDVGPKV
ncbi:hypothetical protein EDC01DRAFT_635313 [Geopyxis carbonaria]|nr:hypothetical protein EDC01DRAFT_635313 [Geopyxis carbonaria]